ncbi:MAG: hypothetical protein ACLFRD_00055 [Nitriliruptoraceae bacterium]
MLIDTTSLFLHVLAAIGLVGGGIVQVHAGARVRAAGTGRDIASWARFTRGAGALIVVAAVLSLLTGGHLAGAVWGGEAGGFANPFITLGTLGLLVLAPIGPMMGGARLRRLAATAEDVGDAAAPDALRGEARAPALWGPVHSLVGVGIGEVALMVYKPGWVVGTLLLLVTFAGGWLVGSILASR